MDKACVLGQSYMVLETSWILGMGCIMSLQIKCTCILKSPNSAREQKEIIREDRGTLGMFVLDGPGGEECGQGGREDLSRILDPT